MQLSSRLFCCPTNSKEHWTPLRGPLHVERWRGVDDVKPTCPDLVRGMWHVRYHVFFPMVCYETPPSTCFPVKVPSSEHYYA